MGSITGDVFVRVSWEDSDPIETPYARVDVLPSQYVFPSFGGPHGVDRKRVNSVLVLFLGLRMAMHPRLTALVISLHITWFGMVSVGMRIE